MSRIISANRTLWRRLQGSAEIRNADLPQHLLKHMEGPVPPSSFASNGSSFSPDRVNGADLRPAAHIHDWCYFRGGSEADRKEADYEFYRNLRECGLPNWLARRYFYRVRFWGVHCFCYRDGSRPRGWQRFKLFFSRYLEW